jgi:hypothetical protein
MAEVRGLCNELCLARHGARLRAAHRLSLEVDAVAVDWTVDHGWQIPRDAKVVVS